jgi:hypothetical protein
MHAFCRHAGPDGRAFRRVHLLWIVPLAMAAAVGLFIGVGFLVTWLWRVTITDVFGVKTISFWQAWGLLLLSQLLFKAHVYQALPIRSRVLHRMMDEMEARQAGTPGADTPAPEVGGA